MMLRHWLGTVTGRLPRVYAVMALAILMVAGTARGEAIKGDIVSVGIGGTSGANGIYRIGSWVPVQVRLQNMTPAPLECRLGVQSNELNDLDGDKVTTLGPVFTLTTAAEPRTLWTYYWPGPDDQSVTGTRGITSVVVFDKTGTQILGEVTTPGRTASAMGLGRADEGRDGTDRSLRFVVVLGKSMAGWNSFQNSWGGTEAVVVAQVKNASQLPDDVKGFDPVDVIVWEADAVKPSEVPGEFQLKAMLQWVKAGGHLMISSGAQWQELLKADQLLPALPITIKESQTLTWADVGSVPNANWVSQLRNDLMKDKTFDHIVGDLKPTARAVITPRGDRFAKTPLVVTGSYGQGAVTLITFDVTNADLAQANQGFSEENWAQFWTQAAGWIWAPDFMTGARYNKLKADPAQRVGDQITTPGTAKLGETIPSDVDVKEFTFVRIFVAIIFLAIYWLLAGPIGHLILRAYRVVHWSWWVFGGTVVLALAVAGGVVIMLHVSSSEVRHKTYVLGRVNSRDVSVTSYYGVYAPASGGVDLTQPDGEGMNYLVPMCFPTNGDVKAYADPQGYRIFADQAAAAHPIFRNTLKKMQGRWNGELAGITGTAEFSADPWHVLKGTLTNDSDYDLVDVDVIVYRPNEPSTFTFTGSPGACYLYRVGSWKKGAALKLDTGATLDTLNAPAKITDWEFADRFSVLLQVLARARAGSITSFRSGGVDWSKEKRELFNVLQKTSYYEVVSKKYPDDVLAALLDVRALDDLDIAGRTEVVRGMGRLIDSTKALHAAGALIIAHSDHDAPVKAPVPLAMNGSALPSKGDVEFIWALPVAGEMPVMTLTPAVPAGGAAADPLRQPGPEKEQ